MKVFKIKITHVDSQKIICVSREISGDYKEYTRKIFNFFNGIEKILAITGENYETYFFSSDLKNKIFASIVEL